MVLLPQECRTDCTIHATRGDQFSPEPSPACHTGHLSRTEKNLTNPLSHPALPPLIFRIRETNRIAKKDVIQVNAIRIESGTPAGDELGFSGDLFSGWLELAGENRLYLHYIISREKNAGNTQALIRTWLCRGYDVRVVMPRPIMQHILTKFRFVPSSEYFPDQYEDHVEVWRCPYPAVTTRPA
jgi:hypothetical protein